MERYIDVVNNLKYKQANNFTSGHYSRSLGKVGKPASKSQSTHSPRIKTDSQITPSEINSKDIDTSMGRYKEHR